MTFKSRVRIKSEPMRFTGVPSVDEDTCTLRCVDTGTIAHLKSRLQ